MSDGSIKIKADLDDKTLHKKLSSISNLGNGAMSILKGSAMLAAGAYGAVSAGMAGAVKMGMAFNSEMERYNTSFATMLGSQEKAKELTEELKKMGASTPFELKDLAQAQQTLMSFGIESDKAKKYLKQLGDVSQGNTEKFKGLSLAFAQVQSSGKLTGQDLMQMINQGFNPLQIISQKTGKSMAQLKEEMSKGAISAKDVADAFETATSKGGMFYGAMEAQSKTFEGQMSTIKDNVSNLAGALTKGLYSTLATNVLPEVNKTIEALQTAFDTGGIQGFIEKLGEVAVTGLGAIIRELPKINGLVTGVLGSMIKNINKKLPVIIPFITGVFNQLISTASATIPELIGQVVPIITQLFNVAIEMLPGLIGGIGTLINTTMDTLTAHIPAFIPIIINGLGTLIVAIGEQLPGFIDSGLALLLGLIDGIVRGLPQLVDKATEVVWRFIEGLASQDGEVLKKAGEMVQKLVEGMIETAPQMAVAVLKLIGALLIALTGAFIRLVQIGVQLSNRIGEGIANGARAMWGKAREILSTIVDSINSGMGNMLSIGRNLVEGIWNGMNNAKDWVFNKIKEFAKGITDKIKKFFGIHSPSRLFEKEVGLNLVLGLGQGFTKNIDSVYDDMEKAMDLRNKEVQKEIDGALNISYGEAELKYEIKHINDNPIYINNELMLDGEKVTKTVEKYQARDRVRKGG